jgi:5-methyltetrahydrofolate--homocysteine methyltransferase
MNERLQAIYDAVLEGDIPATQQGVVAALAANEAPDAILNQAMVAAMDAVGERYECGEYYLAEMLVAARAMQAGVTVLRPHLAASHVQSAGRVVLGTVKGDMHDIGKNLVGMMLEGAGFEVYDLGADVAPQRFVQAVQERQPDIVALSALLTTTMANMKITIDALTAAGLRHKVKVIVGGAPVNQEYAAQIGADGYTRDASQAAGLARSLATTRGR